MSVASDSWLGNFDATVILIIHYSAIVFRKKWHFGKSVHFTDCYERDRKHAPTCLLSLTVIEKVIMISQSESLVFVNF